MTLYSFYPPTEENAEQKYEIFALTISVGLMVGCSLMLNFVNSLNTVSTCIKHPDITATNQFFY